MLQKFKNSLQTFLYGRNGVDQLFQPLVIGALVLTIANIIVQNPWWTLGLGIASTAVFVYAFWRVFSKNTAARRAENAKYLKAEHAVKSWWNLTVQRFKERKTSVFPKCPRCKTRFRVPRVKGKHTVRCPRCANTFKVKIR